jgi:hypothetical protein
MRLISQFRHPLPFLTPLPGHTIDDTPTTSVPLMGATGGVAFDPVDPRNYFLMIQLYGSNGTSLFKARYDGEFTTSASSVGGLNQMYFGSSVREFAETTEMASYVNLTKSADTSCPAPAANCTISEQIKAYGNWDPRKFGPIAPDIAGTTRVGGVTYVILQQNLQSQDTPGAIWMFNASTGRFFSECITWTGQGCASFKGSKIHAAGGMANGAWSVSLHPMDLNNSAYRYGGRFSAQVLGVKMSAGQCAARSGCVHDGTYGSNTALAWPLSDPTYGI